MHLPPLGCSDWRADASQGSVNILVRRCSFPRGHKHAKENFFGERMCIRISSVAGAEESRRSLVRTS